MCLPGMSCWENQESECNNDCVTITVTWPNGCTSEITINTSQIIYNGPNLPNSGIETGDTFTTLIEKLDNALGS